MSAEGQNDHSWGHMSTWCRKTGHLLLLCWSPHSGTPATESFHRDSEMEKRDSKRPKADLKHSNQSVIWLWAKSMMIISQSESVGTVGVCQAGARRPSGDLNCLFPSLTPLVLSPCPPDPASGTGWWVIQSSVSEVTPCRRAEGDEDTTVLFNLFDSFSLSFQHYCLLLALCYHSCVQMV